MHHLIANRMMFGNMVLVDSPIWVERYNKALGILAGRRTELSEFHIDISGFSPEIADELGDQNYLKPQHGHRQFIILTTQQASSPMLTGDFSFLREGLKDFIRKNEAAISTITAFDVLVGDIDDSSWRVRTPQDLSKVRSVRYSAGSLSGGCADSARMKALADRFMTEPDAWMDEVLISEMVQLAKKGGDFVRNPVRIEDLTIRIQSFYTGLFGGVYVINNPKTNIMVFRVPKSRPSEGVPHYALFNLNSPNLFSSLERAGFIESLVSNRSEALVAIQRKMDYAMIACICRQGQGLIGALDARGLRLVMAREKIPASDVLTSLTSIYKDIDVDMVPDVLSAYDPVWPYVHRAAHGPEEAVINAILAEGTLDDPAPLFALNKEAFFRVYAGWDDDRQRCYAQRISEDYMSRKAQFRTETFGHRTLLRNPEDTEISV